MPSSAWCQDLNAARKNKINGGIRIKPECDDSGKRYLKTIPNWGQSTLRQGSKQNSKVQLAYIGKKPLVLETTDWDIFERQLWRLCCFYGQSIGQAWIVGMESKRSILPPSVYWKGILMRLQGEIEVDQTPPWKQFGSEQTNYLGRSLEKWSCLIRQIIL